VVFADTFRMNQYVDKRQQQQQTGDLKHSGHSGTGNNKRNISFISLAEIFKKLQVGF